MPNLFDKPDCCPLCKGKWEFYQPPGIQEDIEIIRRYRCTNYEVCHFFFDEVGFVDEGAENYKYFLHKDLPNNIEIWWDLDDKLCEIKYGKMGYSKIDFTPPYEVDEKRLKIFLLFS